MQTFCIETPSVFQPQDYIKFVLFDIVMSSTEGWQTLLKTSSFQFEKEFYAEAATRGVLWKKMFLSILQNSQESFFYGTPTGDCFHGTPTGDCFCLLEA